jgi:hypothetical protein
MMNQPISTRVHEYIKTHSGCTPAEITEALGLVRRTVNKAVENLSASYKIHNINPNKRPAMYSVDKLAPSPVMTKPNNGPGYTHKPLGKIEAESNLFKRPVYKGEELKPYTGRPDANDHQQCGTIVNGVWKPYTPPGLMCVGISSPVAQQGAARGRFSA